MKSPKVYAVLLAVAVIVLTVLARLSMKPADPTAYKAEFDTAAYRLQDLGGECRANGGKTTITQEDVNLLQSALFHMRDAAESKRDGTVSYPAPVTEPPGEAE